VPFTRPVRAGPAATLLAPGPAPAPGSLPAAGAVVAAVRRRSAPLAAPPVVAAAVRPPVSPVPPAAVPVHNLCEDLSPYFSNALWPGTMLREQSVCLFVLATIIVEIANLAVASQVQRG
jgi:hypothetical protein